MKNNSLSNESRNWLLFVEDPGAAVYARFLPKALKSKGINLTVLATSHARAFFNDQILIDELFIESTSPDAIFREFQPELLIIGTSENPETFAFALCDEARKQGIPSVGLVDSAANVPERFRGKGSEPLSNAPNWLIVPDVWTAHSFEKLGFNRERISIAGHPRYDEIYDQRKKWTEAERFSQRERLFGIGDIATKIIVFVSEISAGLNHQQYQRSEAYTISGKPTSTGRTEIVIDEVLECIAELSLKSYLVLRLHPKQSAEDLPDHAHSFDYISKAESALEVVNAADLVVGMTSMLMQESALMGRPTLSIVPKPDERYWLGSMSELISCVWTKQQILKAMPEMLSDAWRGVNPDLMPKQGSKRNITKFLINSFATFTD